MQKLAVVIFGLLLLSLSAYGQGSCGGDKVFTARNCAGDDRSPPEAELYGLITKYRSANGLREIALSPSLSKLANRHLIDIRHNVKTFSHSWSNCPYDIAKQETWPCITDAPTRLNSGYDGQGYETIYRVQNGSVQPALALEAWKKSALHNSIILGQGMFTNMPWNAVGVAIDGNFAAVWFGYPGSKTRAPGARTAGIGVSFDEAVDGLAKILSIDKKSSTVESNKWQGLSSDKKIKLEIFGARTNISEATLEIALKLDADKLNAKSVLAIATLLENLFPDWPDRVSWIDKSIAAILANRGASRTKLVQNRAIEFRADGADSIKLSVTPRSK